MKKRGRIVEFDPLPEPEPEPEERPPPPKLDGPFQRMPAWPPQPLIHSPWRPPIESAQLWSAFTCYDTGTWMKEAGKIFVCRHGGMTGACRPIAVGCGIFAEITITDGTVVWLCMCDECLRLRSSTGRAPAF